MIKSDYSFNSKNNNESVFIKSITKTKAKQCVVWLLFLLVVIYDDREIHTGTSVIIFSFAFRLNTTSKNS